MPITNPLQNTAPENKPIAFEDESLQKLAVDELVHKYSQYSLYHQKNNSRPLREMIELANATLEPQALLDYQIENIAINCLQPERYLLHEVFSQLLIHVVMTDSAELKLKIKKLFSMCDSDLFLQKTHALRSEINRKLDERNADNHPLIFDDYWKSVDISRDHAKQNFQRYVENTAGVYSAPYQTFKEVESKLAGDYFYAQGVRMICSDIVARALSAFMQQSDVVPLPVHAADERVIVIVAGAIASGKSSAMRSVRIMHPDLHPMLVSADDWMDVILDGQHFADGEMNKGRFNLSEAYFIKQQIFALLNQKNTALQLLPNILVECMSPADNGLLKLAAGNGTKVEVYIHTSSPMGVLTRMEARGAIEHRYVDPVTTLKSYVNVYPNIIKFIMMATNQAQPVYGTLVLRDTDASHAPNVSAQRIKAAEQRYQYAAKTIDVEERQDAQKELTKAFAIDDKYKRNNPKVMEVDLLSKSILIDDLPRFITCILRTIEIDSKMITKERLALIVANPVKMFTQQTLLNTAKKLDEQIAKLFQSGLTVKVNVNKKEMRNVSSSELQNMVLVYVAQASKAANLIGARYRLLHPENQMTPLVMDIKTSSNKRPGNN